MATTALKINIKRLKERLDQVNRIGRMEGGGVCRLALSDEDRQVRDLLKEWFAELGLHYQCDQLGNMIGTWGEQNSNPVIMGSHLDTVGTGGYFDGSLGVVAGMEVVQCLMEEGIKPSRPVAVINFTNEEGVRFTPDMMGSYAFAGLGKVEDLWQSGAEENGALTLRSELERIGYLGDLSCGSYRPDAYFELHIEQGPVLEKEGVRIGAVEKVQGIYWTEYLLKGTANHAGTTPMSMRKDSGYVASRINAYVRELTHSLGGAQVGTVGITEVYPNLINVVPERVRLTVDLRNTKKEDLDLAQKRLDQFVSQACEEESLLFERNELVRFDPVDFDPSMVTLVESAAEELGFSVKRMPSGAGHDAQMMASICPSTMIFIPSKDGISHNITEFSYDEDIEAGANVLLAAVLKRLEH